MSSPRRLDRGLVLAAALVAVPLLAVLLIAAPARFMTEDDAKYLGIGANLFAGHGPTTVFGDFFPYHSPLWPAIVAAPRAMFGLDPIGWAHLLAIASGCAIVALTAWFGWRIVPLAGALATATVVAFPYFLSLGRGLGLDLPAAFLALAYVAVGVAAVRRGSIRWAIAAGALFALAFLVKEIALPFAPVPFLAGLARGIAVRTIARLAGAALLVSAIGTSWWFVVFAQKAHSVYRLGTPAWTLAPLAVTIVVVGVGLLLVGRPGRAAASDRPGSTGGIGSVRLGWIGTVVWTIALTLFFARSRAAVGGGFLEPAQVRYYLSAWLPDLGPILAIGLGGAAIAVAERLRAARAGDPTDTTVDWAAVDDLIVATLCGLPLVLLVVSVGEIPRHYIAQLAILAALGSAGWVRIVGRLIRRPDRITGAIAALGCLVAGAILAPLILERGSPRLVAGIVVGLVVAGVAVVLVRRVRSGRSNADAGAGPATSDGSAATAAGRFVPLALSAAFLVGALLVAAATVLRPAGIIDVTKAAVVQSTVDWVRANVPPGSTVAFGAILGYETAIQLQGDYPAVRLTEYQDLRADPAAPLGVRRIGQPPSDDWIALTAAPRVVSSLYGYRAGPLESRIRDLGVRVWIQNGLRSLDNPTTIGEALRGASGASAVAHWSRPYSPGALDTTVFTIDPQQLQFSDRIFVGPTAMDTIVRALEQDRARPATTVANLLGRAIVWPDGDPARAIVDRLRKLAGN